MNKSTLITDFDNTLYDWFQVWHESFSAMLSKVVQISGLDEQVLLPEIRKVHQKFGTSEYAFLMEDLSILREKFPHEDLAEIFDEAIHAYRSARKANLRLYEGVKETLEELKRRSILVAVYTDSLAFYTIDRVRRLQLDGLIDFVFSPPDHAVPVGMTNHSERREFRLTSTKHLNLPQGVIKPNPEVLLDILSDVSRLPSEAVYLGDSLTRDVAMAQDAGVTDVYAEYGVVQNHPGYDLLRATSHWTDEAIQRERVTSKRVVLPTYTISSFGEILKFF